MANLTQMCLANELDRVLELQRGAAERLHRVSRLAESMRDGLGVDEERLEDVDDEEDVKGTIIALILLLNLLIAMLSETFATVMESQTLAYRIAFARLMLKYEIFARSFFFHMIDLKRQDG